MNTARKLLTAVGASTLLLVSIGCDDAPVRHTVVLSGDTKPGGTQVKNIKANSIKATDPSIRCQWWLWYDIPNQKNKAIELVSGTEVTAGVNLTKKYDVYNSKTKKTVKFKATTFESVGCGPWEKIR